MEQLERNRPLAAKPSAKPYTNKSGVPAQENSNTLNSATTAAAAAASSHISPPKASGAGLGLDGLCSSLQVAQVLSTVAEVVNQSCLSLERDLKFRARSNSAKSSRSNSSFQSRRQQAADRDTLAVDEAWWVAALATRTQMKRPNEGPPPEE